MKNFVSDLLELRVRNNTFKLVFWKTQDQEWLISKEIIDLDEVDLEKYKKLELLSFESINEIVDLSKHPCDDVASVRIRTVIVLNVRQEEE